MAKARINENGDLINAETGEILGNVQQGVNFDSYDGEMYSLDDFGVSLPDPPDEEVIKRRKEAARAARSSSSSFEDEDIKVEKIVESQSSSSAVYNEAHIDNGLTSFVAKRSKYEVTRDTFFIIKFGLVQMEDERFVPIPYESVPENHNAEAHWVKFRMWNYDEELKWKAECLEYDAKMKGQVINTDKLNERKLKMLLLDWSFGEYEDRLKLLHCDGKLSDESYSILRGMYPSIVNVIVNLMNNVLENNQ